MQDSWFGLREITLAAVQAVSAVIGLIVLIAYTVYTRRMMKLAEQTKRATMTPVFSVAKTRIMGIVDPPSFGSSSCQTSSPPQSFQVYLTIRNVGQGPAILLRCWHQPVSSKFTLQASETLRTTPDSELGYVGMQDLVKNESCSINFAGVDLSRPWLFVIEASDTANGKNQLQVHFRPDSSGNPEGYTSQWLMVHGWGDTFGERFINAITRLIQISKAIEALVDKYDSPQ